MYNYRVTFIACRIAVLNYVVCKVQSRVCLTPIVESMQCYLTYTTLHT